MCRLISTGSPKVAFDSIQYFFEPSSSIGLWRRASGVLSYSARRSFSVRYSRPFPWSHVWSFASPHRPRAYWRAVPSWEYTMSTFAASPRSFRSLRSCTLSRSESIFQNIFRFTFRCSRIIRAVRIVGKSNSCAICTKLFPCCHDHAIFFAWSFTR